MIRASCALAGLAVGGMIAIFLILWMTAMTDHPMPAPTLGEGLLAGLAFGAASAFLIALLAALQARVAFAPLFAAVLLTALITGVFAGLLALVIKPLLALAVLTPLIGYLVGLVFCILCRRFGLRPLEFRR
ncbi:hypothetical protein [Brevundimonas sp.]|jgi:hypothetical protein|uniref:hypothetical protein n=1 Tax=Brevundimonas sp. TaxID=1871086 RepID=UPI0037BF970A